MRNCEINIEKGVPVVKTYPGLMQDILAYTDFNVDQALDLYGIALTDDFKNLNIENPTLQNVIAYIEQDNIDNSGKLSKEDRQNLLNISVQPEYYQDLKDRFINAFNVNGEFGIDIGQLTDSGLFTKSDILEMDTTENINKLKQLYYKLNNTDEQFDTISSKIGIKQGLFSKMNPDEFLQNAYSYYMNSRTSQDIINKANEVGDDLVLENNSIIPLILEAVKNKQSFVQYEQDSLTGRPVKKDLNNTLAKFQQTIDLEQNYDSLLSQLDYIKNQPIELYIEDFELISRYFSNIEKHAADLGLDLTDLATTIEDKTHNEIVDYLDTLYNFLYDINDIKSQLDPTELIASLQETLPVFTETHNAFFEIQPAYTNTVSESTGKNGVYLHLESQQSEEDLFNSNSILKVRDNIYQKITDDKTLDQLYELLFVNPELLPKGTLSVKPSEINRDIIYDDIDQYVSELAQNHLTEDSDIDNLKKMVTYKILSNIQDVNTEKMLNGIDNLDVSRFLINFNKLRLKNTKVQDLFYFSNRGLEANQIVGAYTAKDIKNSIPASDFDNLVLYAKLSGNESLDYFTNFNNDLSPENTRDYYANNMYQLPVFQGEHYFDNGYLVARSSDPFIRFKNLLYENVAPNVYAQVETDNRYTNYNLQKPKYTSTITPELKGQDSQEIKIVKMRNIKDNTIEFC